jgi:integrase
MPKIIKPLSAISVSKITTPGWHAVGGISGLVLQVRDSQSASNQLQKSWVLRTTIGNARVPLGLGSFPQTSLAEARDLAKEMLTDIRNGVDPRVKRKEIQSQLIATMAKNKTFKECAEAYMDSHAAEYSNEKHRKQWRSTLSTYAYPIIGNMLVSEIAMRNILDVLLQEIYDKKTKKCLGKFWEIKTETASRVQQRLKAVFDFAMVNEYRSKNNPAIWDGFLDTQLSSPKKIKKVTHHPSMPYQEIGDFMSKLRANKCISSKALEFLIHSGFRSGSVRCARWSDMDLENKMWRIPAPNTKTKVEHIVPLSPQTLKLLKSLNKAENCDLVFPSPTKKALSDMALSMLMRDMKDRGEFQSDAVPHGFRATFRVWLAEQTSYPDEIRKAASGHKVSDTVKQAYERTTFFDKRRNLMDEWSKFLETASQRKSKVSTVVPIRRKA